MIFPVLLLDEHPWHALDVFVSHFFVFGFNLSLWVMVKLGFMFSYYFISRLPLFLLLLYLIFMGM